MDDRALIRDLMDDRALIRDLEGFHDRRFLAFTGFGVLVFALLVGIIVAGFRENQVYRSSDAVTLVQPSPPRMFAVPPVGPVR